MVTQYCNGCIEMNYRDLLWWKRKILANTLWRWCFLEIYNFLLLLTVRSIIKVMEPDTTGQPMQGAARRKFTVMYNYELHPTTPRWCCKQLIDSLNHNHESASICLLWDQAVTSPLRHPYCHGAIMATATAQGCCLQNWSQIMMAREYSTPN